ncbi:MAG: glutamate-1-semialdehyde 2,1-aminomutase [Candidatus Dormibacteraceae bacterium]
MSRVKAGASAAFLEEARRRFPGGVQSPVRAYAAVAGEPPVPVRGEGGHVWDLEGAEYVDWVCAYGPLIAGHAHPAVVRAIERASRLGGPFGATVEGELRLARLIQARMPSLERLRFVNSGTEAAMSALRVARAATGRDLVLKFEGGYHGHADHLLASAGSGLATLGLPGSAGVPAGFAAATLVVPRELAAVETVVRARAGQIAAVIVEPVAANVGVIEPAPGLLEGLRRLCSEIGALLVFDEVITGFRVAPGGAQERYRVTPDLTVLGKIIGGGLPVGAYGGRAELMDLVAPSGPVYQAGTLSGHPLVMAAGEATLELLDAAAYDRLEQLGAALEAGLARHGRVARVGSLLTLFCESADAFAELHATLRRGGVLVPPSQFEAWFLSLAHTESDIEQTLEALG